ncbi:hypothetical protein ILYODFUR_023453 [Ilyodon furcidens]|uniref:Ankyrin 2b, neuronal n=1 Tax=Ilyodon furcidens TaxID=33524 RepID=A0ABV0TAG4_9TELE
MYVSKRKRLLLNIQALSRECLNLGCLSGQPLPQDFFTKEIQRQAQQKDYLVLVSPSTFKTNISQSSKQSNVDMGQMQGFQVEKLLLTHHSNTAIIVSPIAPALDLVKTEHDIRLTSQSSFPQETYEYTESDSVTLETQDNGDEPTTMSSNSSPTPQESGSPQLDQLLSDLKEMKLKFSPERLDSYASESFDDSPEKEEAHTHEEPSSEEEPRPDKRDEVSVFTDAQLTEYSTNVRDCSDAKRASESNIDIHQESNLSPTDASLISELPQKFGEEIDLSPNSGPFQFCRSMESFTDEFSSLADPPEKKPTYFNKEDLTITTSLSHEAQCLPIQSFESRGITEEASAQTIKDQCLWDGTSTETTSSQCGSDFTPDTVTSARHFSFDEPITYPSSSSVEIPSVEDRPMMCEQHSEETMTPAEYECFATESPSFQLKTDISSSASDEEYTIPLGDAETSFASVTYTSTPLRIAHGAHCIEDSPNLEYFDVEPYFDCKQGMCDFSETELDAPESTSSLNVDQAQHQPGHLGTQEKAKQKVLLSSGSEDYEDAPLVHESYHQGHGESKESLRQSETSDEEFTLCKTSQPSGTYYSNKSLQREVSAEFGSISESSDEEFLTTRIIRRVVIKIEQMVDLPTESVTEETYRDENGHLVIKRVTRKVISKRVSVDGVEHEEIPSEEAPQQSFTVADGDSCSKDKFPKSEGSPSSRQERADLEKKTVVDGERTTTSQGDQSLASDLPSAQNDFQQGPHA